MLIALKKRKQIAFLALMLCVITFVLSACSSIKPLMSASQTRDNLDTINTALVTTQGMTSLSTKKNSNEIEFSRATINTLNVQDSNLKKVISSFKKTNNTMGFQKATLAYAKDALAYSNKVKKATNLSDLTSDYHKLAEEGSKVYEKMPVTERRNRSERLMASVMAYDVKQPHKTKIGNQSQSEQQKKDKQLSSSQIFYPSKSKKYDVTLNVILIVLSMLLITFVFLQPSKANDAMNALADTAGNDLLSEAKPDDYTLFLMRGTVVFAVIIVGILGYLEFKG